MGTLTAAFRRLAGGSNWALFAAYCAIVLILRAPTFGNPTLHIDEQFYLLVGDRMWQGQWPYIDIWDRKSLGLFLLFAGLRQLGGDGVLAYQIAAALSVAATCLVINRLARRIAAPAGAFWAGAAYVPWLAPFNLYGGQAPVFYNLLTALAVLVTVRALTARAPSPRLLASGCGAMALLGLAMQLKYNVAFEGAAIGLMLLWGGWRAGWNWIRLAGAALLWAGIALVPTLLTLALYANWGEAALFLDANFLSILRRDEPFDGAVRRIVKWSLFLIPFWIGLALAWRLPADPQADPLARRLLALWLAAALTSFVIFGTWFDHYIGPLLPPLCVVIAPVLGRPGRLRWLTALVLAAGLIIGGITMTKNLIGRGNARQIAAMTALINRERGTGCLYLADGDPILYKTTNACTVTRFIFATHLASTVEHATLNQPREVERIIAARPAVVLIPELPLAKPPNWPVRKRLLQAMSLHYTHYATAAIGKRRFRLYRLNPPAS